MPAFLDLPPHQVDFLELTVQHDVGSSIIRSHLGDLGIVKHGLDINEPIEPHLFTVILCNVGAINEAGTRQVSIRGDRIGYVFPLTSFRTGTGIGDGWPAKFAEAGFRKILNLDTIHQFSLLRSTSELRDAEYYLDEVFSDDHVLAVFSNEALERVGLQDSCLRLSLLEAKIQEVASYNDFTWGRVETSTANIKMRIPSNFAAEDYSVFCSIISRADKDEGGIGSFLAYYQIIEYCIDSIFRIEIKRLPTLDIDTWKLRETLATLSNEVSRIGMLDQRYLSRSARRACFNDLKQECMRILTALGENVATDMPWYKALYKVRNVVVHNQMRFHRDAAYLNLADANRVLRQACFEALFCFSPPEEVAQLVAQDGVSDALDSGGREIQM